MSRRWRPLLAPLLLGASAAGAAVSAGWAQVALLTAALFFGAKALVLARPEGRGARAAPAARFLAWHLVWPGMDPRPFFDLGRRAARPSPGEWMLAAAKGGLGAALLVLALGLDPGGGPWLRGGLALLGLALLVLHGLMHLASLALRHHGVVAPPIFDRPLLARSPGEFWGRRWNRAFREMARLLVLRPLRGRCPRPLAFALVFLLSGLAHDLILSLPAGGGYGGPTAYFALQGLGLWLEQGPWGRPLRTGWRGRLFAWLLVAGPLPLLFHAPFLDLVLRGL